MTQKFPGIWKNSAKYTIYCTRQVTNEINIWQICEAKLMIDFILAIQATVSSSSSF